MYSQPQMAGRFSVGVDGGLRLPLLAPAYGGDNEGRVGTMTAPPMGIGITSVIMYCGWAQRRTNRI